MTNKSAIIAAMAAGLFSAGAPLAASAADAAKVHCQGVNSCKGKSACSTATSCPEQWSVVALRDALKVPV